MIVILYLIVLLPYNVISVPTKEHYLYCNQNYSGKTKRAIQLKTELEARGKNTQIVSESLEIAAANLTKNECFNDHNNEKRLRASLKAKVISLLDQQTTIILDASNYIKGHRYELYCASKACKTTQCTVFTIININEAKILNKKRSVAPILDKCICDENNLNVILENTGYSDETFEALALRFEEPNSQNRWDSPLFIIQFNEDIDVDKIYKALYERKPPPPNMSTQNPPLSATNFLYELDKVVQNITKHILESKKINNHSEIHFPDYTSFVLDAQSVQAAQPFLLQKLRRQFISFAKIQYSNHNLLQIGSLYVQYLNANLKQN